MAEFTYEDLAAFAEAERQALLAFDMDHLAELVELKEALSQALEDGRVDLPSETLSELRKRFEENSNHFAAAMEGVKSARMRLDAVKRVADGFESYGPDGQLRTAPQKPGTLARRA